MANTIEFFRNGNGQSYHINTEVVDNGYPVRASGIKAYVDAATPGNATSTKAGLVKQSAAVPEAAGETPTAAEFKALLDALKAAGIMSTT